MKIEKVPDGIWEIEHTRTHSRGLEATYRRGDLFEKRSQLMTAWARY